MVEECTDSNELAHHIVSGEINREGSCSAGWLGCVGFDTANESTVVRQSKVEIHGQVVAYALLRTTHLQDSVEISYLVSTTNDKRLLRSLDELTGRGVKCKSSAVAVFDVGCDVIVHGHIHTKQRSELFGYRYRRNVVWR